MPLTISQRCCLQPEHYTAIKELKQMKHVMFLQPDKGSGIVVMNRPDYISKMESILGDTRKFQLDNTPENNILVEKQVARKLQILLLHGYINESQYSHLKPTGTQTPRMRGAPKIHKAGFPLRPIMCMNNSPYHNVARWLAKLLDTVRKLIATYCLKDSFELAETLEQLSLSAELMYSIDVDSLFTKAVLVYFSSLRSRRFGVEAKFLQANGLCDQPRSTLVRLVPSFLRLGHVNSLTFDRFNFSPISL
ncbi:unnamed protein product [Dicrocoelium dendriticum]|nr:unnamed protein product [Dicrocoelium dendriticum]